MSNSGCWGCGQFAPGGVCMGPHPKLDMREAVHHRFYQRPQLWLRARYAEPSRCRVITETKPVRYVQPCAPEAWDPEPEEGKPARKRSECPKCGHKLVTGDSLGLWCDNCLWNTNWEPERAAVTR